MNADKEPDLMELRGRRNRLADELAQASDLSAAEAERCVEQIVCMAENAFSAKRKLLEHTVSDYLEDIEELWDYSLRVAALEVAHIPEPKHSVPWHILERVSEFNRFPDRLPRKLSGLHYKHD